MNDKKTPQFIIKLDNGSEHTVDSIRSAINFLATAEGQGIDCAALTDVHTQLQKQRLTAKQVLDADFQGFGKLLPPEVVDGVLLNVALRPLDDLEHSVKTENRLQELGFTIIGEILCISDSELDATKNFGRGSVHELKKLFKELGVEWPIKDPEKIKALKQEILERIPHSPITKLSN